MDSPARTRRSLLAAAATVASTAPLTGCTGGLNGDDGQDGADDGSEPDDGGTGGDGSELAGLPDTVALEPLADGLAAPVAFADAPSAGLGYVVEQPGRIVAVDADGLRDEPVLDLSDAVSAGGEKGMLGLALHPEFAENRRAFVRYSAPSREGTPDGYSHTFVLAEFAASENGTSVDPESERTVLEVPQPQANHNAGDVAFGPDGLLYVPTGDGGGAGDRGPGHSDDWYDAVDGGNGQDVAANALGGLLRIDVDAEPTEHPRTDADAPAEPSGDEGYAIPDANPLVGAAGRDEYYAWGLRNPWRIAFDGGRLYVADVGQDDWEEVNRVERGGNYGWNVREGRHCYGADDCPDAVPDDGVPEPRAGERLRDPIVEYPHDGGAISGISVIGGQVYRGDAVPELGGAYVFADLRPDGRLFATASRAATAGEPWPTTAIDYRGALVTAVYAIGRDATGELYVLGQGSNDGTVWRLRSA